MSDLISRSELIKELNKYCGNQRYLVSENIREIINNQPTAYDVDGVVEQLKETKETSLELVKLPKFLKKDLQELVNMCFDEAIEIFKNGGAETETETIRDKVVKWNNNSSKRVPYEFIDYVDGKREIGVSYDVCEWKSVSEGEFIQNPHTKRLYSNEVSMKNVYCNTCGKKIKIVGDLYGMV